jgi:hypothetical protein
MAISIELWTNDGLVDGAERWWDDIEARLTDPVAAQQTYPLMCRVDPYGDAVLRQEEFVPFIEELRRFSLGAPPTVVAITDELIRLCQVGLGAPAAELRFVGD